MTSFFRSLSRGSLPFRTPLILFLCSSILFLKKKNISNEEGLEKRCKFIYKKE
ncbi:hypothetical protein HanXRQr2_Chr02g0085431 [Helianthus annuus]|uniref:Uncharacterized protein n=1 Tax=Helianthus annuus TaxID=4232 RepID=A0A9K3JRQ1_HELAN|nr:hypothetical protein HanXRQr2_Chr02g0085431 [Helianthus annuus]KAJ0953329.1 hypothetical protein HanPSC8_Chr02g0082581 [Helianthus annuus]